MYSDVVTIKSYFSKYLGITKDGWSNFDYFLKCFVDDLTIINRIKPALEAELIQFFPLFPRICMTCHAKEILGSHVGKKFKQVYKNLEDEILSNINVYCLKDQGLYAYGIESEQSYIEGIDCGIYTASLDKEIAERPTIAKKIEQGKKVFLSKTLIKLIGIHKLLAHKVTGSSIHGLAASKLLNNNFLTESELYIKIINNLQPSEIKRKNILSSEHMTSIVPFVNDINIENLIKIRKREKESFILYRKALRDAINEFRSIDKNFSKNDAEQIYYDVIAPSLAALDLKVKSAKKDLISMPFRSFTGMVGAISFGLLTGIISKDVSAIVSAFGLAKFGGDLIKDLMAVGDKERLISEDNFYFLWKVRQISK